VLLASTGSFPPFRRRHSRYTRTQRSELCAGLIPRSTLRPPCVACVAAYHGRWRKNFVSYQHPGMPSAHATKEGMAARANQIGWRSRKVSTLNTIPRSTRSLPRRVLGRERSDIEPRHRALERSHSLIPTVASPLHAAGAVVSACDSFDPTRSSLSSRSPRCLKP
jgi:hypothetical protein